MDPLVQQAVMLNNDGVRLLDVGNVVGAIETFQRGVTAIQQIGCYLTAQQLDATFLLPLQSELSNAAGTSGNHVTPIRRRTGGKLPGLQHALCFVYDRPLLIQPSTESSMLLVLLQASAYLLFNTGLAWHYYGIVSGQNGPMQRAATFYDLTLQSLWSNCVKAERNDMLGLIQCFALNNLAVLHYDGCVYALCDKCLDYMTDLILWSGCLDGPASKHVLTEYESEELKLNYLYMKPPIAARAA